jgi:hypothetical protein
LYIFLFGLAAANEKRMKRQDEKSAMKRDTKQINNNETI